MYVFHYEHMPIMCLLIKKNVFHYEHLSFYDEHMPFHEMVFLHENVSFANKNEQHSNV
jgi:hypothetical protein